MVKRRLLAGLILGLVLAGPLLANPPTTAIIGTPPQPGWSLLSTQQKIFLAPLADDWDQMENIRRKKWLGIAERFPQMSAEDQQRVQQRMREWASLSPEKRAKIRDSYKEFRQLPREKRQAVRQKWESFSNLSDDEKQRIRQGGKLTKTVAPSDEAPAISPATGRSTTTITETGKHAAPTSTEIAKP
ncbi:MAG: hypothetical protein H6R18_2915 [Proteobacteria bacterium]|nr:hypothetical protein [Pseudomonadota bacterium]